MKRKRPFLIAEIGINHNGSVGLAKKLIDLAKKYNFDAVKFQKKDLNIMDNNIVTLISRDGKDKIVCFKYMEECFRKEGYMPFKNIHTKLLYKLFNYKILRKIFLNKNF